MESFRKKNDGLGSNRLIQKQIGREVSRNEMHIEPEAIRSEENLKARICDLQPNINQGKRKKSFGLDKQRDAPIDGVKFGCTSHEHTQTHRYRTMKLVITEFTDDQATRMASSETEMCMWPPKLSGLSRSIFFYLGML